MANNDNIRYINASAMRCGVPLGLYGILTLAVFRVSFAVPFFSTLFLLMVLASPVVATFLTLHFRTQTAGADGKFTFQLGFLHALCTGLYATLWVAAMIFVYLEYLDHGTLFAAYAAQLDNPEVQAYLRQSGMAAQMDVLTGGKGAAGLAETMQRVGSANYTALALYFSLLAGPVISAIIGLICRREAR